MIPETWLEELKRRVDLVDLGARYGVKWTRGGAEPTACCPFHEEKTSSFHALTRPRTGAPRFVCYGSCGRSWSAVAFLVDGHQREFLEAVEELAGLAGMEVPRRQETAAAAEERRLRAEHRAALRAALELAQDYFAKALQVDRTEAAGARAYLEGRGLDAAVEPWGIGYAPGGDGLVQWLDGHGVAPQVAHDAYLVRVGEDGSRYAFLRRRITLPWRDRQGRVLCHVGRAIDPEARAKYLNAGEIPGIFVKGEAVFGLDMAQQAIAASGEAVVVEGQLSAITPHLHGLENVVACGGKAFSAAHARQLAASGAATAVLLLDGDAAGERGALAAVPVALGAGLPVRVARLPDGQDPDDYLRNHLGGGAELRGLIDAAEDGLAWYARTRAAACPSPLQLDRLLAEELGPLLAQLGPAARGRYVKVLGKVLGLPARVVAQAAPVGEESTSRAPSSEGGPGSSSPPPGDGDAEREAELAAFGKSHFKTWFGGASYVGRETTDDDGRATVLFVTSGDLTRYHKHVKVRVWDAGKEQYRYRELAKEWEEWPGCRTYERVVFRPQGAVSRASYNLWRGFAVSPRQGDAGLYWEHVERVICAGDPETYAYVRKWLAHSVQRVAELPEVALVLRGLQGTGKGWFVRPMAEIFGSHALTVQSMDHVSGRFNAHLKDVCFLFADEAFWGGDRSREGLVKAMVTEKLRLIEPKNKDAQQVDSFLRMVLATNNEWPVAMDHDDRRFVVLDVADLHKEDAAHFQALAVQMANGGTAALMHDLLEEDLSGWHPRQRPRRASGADIKLRSASAVVQWWHECLVEEANSRKGYDGEENEREWWNETPGVGELHDHYRRWCERLNRRYVESRESWGRELRRLAPHLTIHRPSHGTRQRQYVLGTVEQCRESFETYFQSEDWSWKPTPAAEVPF